MKWRVVPGQALNLHSWDDEFVVYNHLSGDTHLLDPAAGRLLLELQRAPADAAALAESLALLLPGADDERKSRAENFLADLAALTLVERV